MTFIDCTKEINNTQVDNAKDTIVVMPTYNLVEHFDNYLKTPGSLWEHYRDKPILTDAGVITDFTNNDNSDSLKFKQKLTGQTGEDNTKNFKIVVLIKYLSKFWRTFEMPLINCEVTLNLTWSANCVISSSTNANQATTFAITDTNFMFRL